MTSSFLKCRLKPTTTSISKITEYFELKYRTIHLFHTKKRHAKVHWNRLIVSKYVFRRFEKWNFCVGVSNLLTCTVVVSFCVITILYGSRPKYNSDGWLVTSTGVWRQYSHRSSHFSFGQH